MSGGVEIILHGGIYAFMRKMSLHRGFIAMMSICIDRHKHSFKDMQVVHIYLMRA